LCAGIMTFFIRYKVECVNKILLQVGLFGVLYII